MRTVLIALAVIACAPLIQTAIASTAPLPAPVAQVARAMKVPESSVSVWVQRIGDAQPRVAVNADTPRNPASVMKLVTSFAAL
ncbi:MAG: D-alanyl-D-alanine carboxypeptidase, partial [Xanthomonadales bacterium]|nr:D-alanyl-D-alanine carboxypeptidase [Xanthomonadales bacterium]